MMNHPLRFTSQPIPVAAACALALTVAAMPAVAGDEATTLPTVQVTSRADTGGLHAQTSTGSNLDLSRFDTPASIDALTRKQLDERGDISLQDAITRAPGITTMAHPGNGGAALSARGFTDTVSVLRLYDGMRQYGGATLTFPFDTWAVERIEAMRGPASVIYGDGAIGAVINIVPKQPTRGAIQTEMQAGIGTEHSRRFAVGSGGAIDERWSYRVDASSDRSDGWVERGDYSNRSFSGALRFDISPRLNLRLSAASGRQQPMRYFGTPLVDGKPDPAIERKNYNVADSVIQYNDRWFDLLVNWKPNDDVTLRSRFYDIDSDRHWREVEAYRYNPLTRLIDRADATEILHDQSQAGNTTDAAFRGTLFGLANQFSLGFDYNASKFKHTNNTYVGTAPSVDPYHPVPGSFASAIPTIPRYRSEARQAALFAEDRLLMNARWSLLAGLRYDHSRVERTDLVANKQAYDRTFSHVGWRLGSVYQLTPALALYGQYARAADPISSQLFLSPANSKFDSASGRQLELGLKQSVAGGNGEWTLAVFDIAKHNLLTRDAANPAQSIQVGQRSARGIELTASALLAPGWTLEGNATVLRARFDDFSESVGGVLVSRSGKTPPNVASRTAHLWLHHAFASAWSGSAGLRYVGASNADNANTIVLPGYAVTDASLRWRLAAGTSLTLRVANVFDKRYFTTAYYTPTQWFYGQDRRTDLILNHRF